jgi:cell wall-associated NlpC family hydrolase
LGGLLVTALLGTASLAAAHGGGADPAPAVVAAARSQLGDRYAWGATGPDAFDCSGLTSSVWGSTGHVRAMPRTSAQQQAWTVPIPAEQALPGDLAFFGDPVTHVGLITGRTQGQLQMVDASETRKGVVERTVWTSGVVRFGRVPRPGMPAVRPWTPQPQPTAAPTPATKPAVKPAVKPATKPAGKPKPAGPAPLVDPHDPALRGKAPLVGLPSAPAQSSAAMLRYVRLARAQVGSRTWTDTGLVTALWRQAGGTTSPDSRAAIHNRTHRVLLRNAQVGDLVVYPAPGDHVGIYVGGGLMVDASRALGSVVLRPVWAATGVQVVRWSR